MKVNVPSDLWFLPNLKDFSCTLYIVHCTLYTVQCSLYTIHSSLYTALIDHYLDIMTVVNPEPSVLLPSV